MKTFALFLPLVLAGCASTPVDDQADAGWDVLHVAPSGKRLLISQATPQPLQLTGRNVLRVELRRDRIPDGEYESSSTMLSVDCAAMEARYDMSLGVRRDGTRELAVLPAMADGVFLPIQEPSAFALAAQRICPER